MPGIIIQLTPKKSLEYQKDILTAFFYDQRKVRGLQNLHFEKLIPFLGSFGKGFLMTIQTTVVSFLLAIVLAILLASMRMSKVKPLVWFHDIWVLVIRSLPLLLQLFILTYLPGTFGVRVPVILSGEITLAINASAYMTESIRGGIMGVDKGQREAAMALGIGPVTTFFFITIPQAVKFILPALLNEVIQQFKSTSMLAQIGVAELFLASHNMLTATFASFEPYLFVAVIYYVCVLLLTKLSSKVERRLSRSDRS